MCIDHKKEDRRFLPALSSSQSERVEGEPRQPRKAKPAPKDETTQEAGETTATESDAAADSKQEDQE